MEEELLAWQERPSAMAMTIERILDAMTVLVVMLVIAAPFFAFARDLGSILLWLGFAGIFGVAVRLIFDLLERECTHYVLEPDQLIVECGLVTPQRIVVPLDQLRPQNIRARQSWRGRIGGYGSLVLTVPEIGPVELKFLEDLRASRTEIVKRLKADPAPTLIPVPVPVRSSTGWMSGLIFALVGLFFVLGMAGLYFTLTSFEFTAPSVGPVPVRVPLPFGGYIDMDALDFLRAYLSILTTPPFSLIIAVLILLLIVRIIYTFGLRRR